MKGFYQYLRNSRKNTLDKTNTRKWVKESVVKKVERPTRVDRARSLGYRAKQGFIIVRTRIAKGGRKRQTIRKGRKPKKSGIYFTPSTSLQSIAEKRVVRKFPNLEVLNSYYIGEDGKYKFYEIILVDTNHPVIKKDRRMKWILNKRRRVFRGLTSTGKRSRGL